jgi:hypothetical protein
LEIAVNSGEAVNKENKENKGKLGENDVTGGATRGAAGVSDL